MQQPIICTNARWPREQTHPWTQNIKHHGRASDSHRTCCKSLAFSSPCTTRVSSASATPRRNREQAVTPRTPSPKPQTYWVTYMVRPHRSGGHSHTVTRSSSNCFPHISLAPPHPLYEPLYCGFTYIFKPYLGCPVTHEQVG